MLTVLFIKIKRVLIMSISEGPGSSDLINELYEFLYICL